MLVPYKQQFSRSLVTLILACLLLLLYTAYGASSSHFVKELKNDFTLIPSFGKVKAIVRDLSDKRHLFVVTDDLVNNFTAFIEYDFKYWLDENDEPTEHFVGGLHNELRYESMVMTEHIASSMGQCVFQVNSNTFAPTLQQKNIFCFSDEASPDNPLEMKNLVLYIVNTRVHTPLQRVVIPINRNGTRLLGTQPIWSDGIVAFVPTFVIADGELVLYKINLQTHEIESTLVLKNLKANDPVSFCTVSSIGDHYLLLSYETGAQETAMMVVLIDILSNTIIYETKILDYVQHQIEQQRQQRIPAVVDNKNIVYLFTQKKVKNYLTNITLLDENSLELEVTNIDLSAADPVGLSGNYRVWNGVLLVYTVRLEDEYLEATTVELTGDVGTNVNVEMVVGLRGYTDPELGDPVVVNLLSLLNFKTYFMAYQGTVTLIHKERDLRVKTVLTKLSILNGYKNSEQQQSAMWVNNTLYSTLNHNLIAMNYNPFHFLQRSILDAGYNVELIHVSSSAESTERQPYIYIAFHHINETRQGYLRLAPIDYSIVTLFETNDTQVYHSPILIDDRIYSFSSGSIGVFDTNTNLFDSIPLNSVTNQSKVMISTHKRLKYLIFNDTSILDLNLDALTQSGNRFHIHIPSKQSISTLTESSQALIWTTDDPRQVYTFPTSNEHAEYEVSGSVVNNIIQFQKFEYIDMAKLEVIIVERDSSIDVFDALSFKRAINSFAIPFATIGSDVHLRHMIYRSDVAQLLLVGPEYQLSALSFSIQQNRPAEISTPLIAGIVSASIFLLLICLLIPYGVCIHLIRKNRIRDQYSRLLQEKLLQQDVSTNNSDRYSNVMIDIRELTFEKRVSEGAAGVVYLGKWKDSPVAIKRMKVDQSDDFIREVGILNSLRHPHIIMFYGMAIDENENHYIITEFVSNGSMDTHLLYSKKPMRNFRDKIQILLEVALGMEYLHSMKIIHRDLKPSNLLIDAQMHVKICDFGVSKHSETQEQTVGVAVGTLEYMAPEIIEQNGMYDSKCDVFSFGIMMHEVFTLKKPYISNEPLGFVAMAIRISKGLRPDIPFDIHASDYVIQTLKDFFYPGNDYKFTSDVAMYKTVTRYLKLCELCWHQDPSCRPSFDLISKELASILTEMDIE